jgi:hypothetical protein
VDRLCSWASHFNKKIIYSHPTFIASKNPRVLDSLVQQQQQHMKVFLLQVTTKYIPSIPTSLVLFDQESDMFFIYLFLNMVKFSQL